LGGEKSGKQRIAAEKGSFNSYGGGRCFGKVAENVKKHLGKSQGFVVSASASESISQN
jgi:hypothetical protein